MVPKRPADADTPAVSEHTMRGSSPRAFKKAMVNDITPDAFASEKGHKHFSKLWWDEVIKGDSFWQELNDNIPAQILRERLQVRIVQPEVTFNVDLEQKKMQRLAKQVEEQKRSQRLAKQAAAMRKLRAKKKSEQLSKPSSDQADAPEDEDEDDRHFKPDPCPEVNKTTEKEYGSAKVESLPSANPVEPVYDGQKNLATSLSSEARGLVAVSTDHSRSQPLRQPPPQYYAPPTQGPSSGYRLASTYSPMIGHFPSRGYAVRTGAGAWQSYIATPSFDGHYHPQPQYLARSVPLPGQAGFSPVYHPHDATRPGTLDFPAQDFPRSYLQSQSFPQLPVHQASQQTHLQASQHSTQTGHSDHIKFEDNDRGGDNDEDEDEDNDEVKDEYQTDAIVLCPGDRL